MVFTHQQLSLLKTVFAQRHIPILWRKGTAFKIFILTGIHIHLCASAKNQIPLIKKVSAITLIHLFNDLKLRFNFLIFYLFLQFYLEFQWSRYYVSKFMFEIQCIEKQAWMRYKVTKEILRKLRIRIISDNNDK